MSELHGLASAAVAVLLLALATTSAGLAIARRAPRWLDAFRLAVLGLLVAEAAIGLALFAAGGRPGELLHWLYAGAAIVGLMAVGSIETGAAPRPRAGAVAAAGGFALIMVWRLTATG